MAPFSASLVVAFESVALPPFCCSAYTVMLVVSCPIMTGKDANVGDGVGKLVGDMGVEEGMSVDE